jgi:hypothetical protein
MVLNGFQGSKDFTINSILFFDDSKFGKEKGAVCVECFFWKVTGPSPLRGQTGVRPKGGLAGTPPRINLNAMSRTVS